LILFFLIGVNGKGRQAWPVKVQGDDIAKGFLTGFDEASSREFPDSVELLPLLFLLLGHSAVPPEEGETTDVRNAGRSAHGDIEIVGNELAAHKRLKAVKSDVFRQGKIGIGGCGYVKIISRKSLVAILKYRI